MRQHVIPKTRFNVALLTLFAGTALGGCVGAPDVESDGSVGEAVAALSDDGHGHGHGRAVPVIFDTDMDFDDSAALAYLAAEHNAGRIELLAVTVTNNGAGLPGRAIYHARCLLQTFGLSGIPVADNAAQGPHQFPPAVQFGAELILNDLLDGCSESDQPSTVPADQLIAETLRSSRDPVTIVTTGPLTNLANALGDGQDSHGCGGSHLGNLDRVFVMGGAVHVAGNVAPSATEDGTQEYNIWGDPAAAQTVFGALQNVQLVPLDATQFVPVTVDFSARVAGDHHTSEADYVASLLANPLVAGAVEANLGFFWWDPLDAVASQTDGVVTYESDRISVVQSGMSSGRTVISRGHDAPRLRVGIGANTDAFEDVFLDTLNEQHR